MDSSNQWIGIAGELELRDCQGRHHLHQNAPDWVAGTYARLSIAWILPTFHRFLCAMLCIVWTVAFTDSLFAEGFEVRLRVIWGGASLRAYEGNISVADGFVQTCSAISMQVDSAATVELKDSHQILVHPTSPTTYGGLDFQIQGNPNTKVTISLRDPSSKETDAPYKTLEKTLQEILADTCSIALDPSGNALVINRPAEDRLRLNIAREHLVFHPEEAIPLSITGKHLGLGNNTPLKLSVTLLSEPSGKTILTMPLQTTTDDTGSFADLSSETIYAPSQEGVYRLVVRADPKRLLGGLLRDSAVTRSMQFIVAGDKSLVDESADWQVVDTWEPGKGDSIIENFTDNENTPENASRDQASNRSRWLGWRSFNSRGWWSSFGRQPKRGTSDAGVASASGEAILAPNDWYMIPLRIGNPSKPHRLLIQYVADRPMRMGITLLETNAEGLLAPLGVDASVELDSDDIQSPGSAQEHEVVFWPKSSTASLLITNPDTDLPLQVLGYRLLAGPSHLSKSPNTQSDDASLITSAESTAKLEEQQADGETDTDTSSNESQSSETSPLSDQSPDKLVSTVKKENLPPRLAAIYLDKPLLAEYFGGSESIDPATGRGLHDWQTFYQACQHLVEYLKWSGHNGVILFVSGEGGAIYPGGPFGSNFKFDRGRFFSDGRDVIPKDVIELLLRMLDREGLHVLLGLHFDGALPPTLTRHLNADESLELMDASGRVWSRSTSPTLRTAPRYNPLHATVQGVLERSVEDLLQRYGKHSSFRGVVVEMGGAGHLSFGGDRWGYDPATIDNFFRSLGGQFPIDPKEKIQLVQNRYRSAFMQWRASQLTQFIQRLGQRIRNKRSDLRLVVSTAGLAKLPPGENDFLEWSDLWLQPEYISLSRGLDLPALSKVQEVDLLHSDIRYPLHQLPQQRWSYAVRDLSWESPQVSLYPRGGSLVLLPPSGRNWPSVELQQPLGLNSAKVWTFHQAYPVSSTGRASWSSQLLTQDRWLMATGGWGPNFGAESTLRESIGVWTALPPVVFSDHPGREGQSLSQGVKIRTAEHDGQTFIQLINAAPWKQKVTLQFAKAPDNTKAYWVGESSNEIPVSWLQQSSWSVDLEAHQWKAICVDSPNFSIDSWQNEVDSLAIEKAKNQLLELSERVKKLHTTQLAPLPSLINGDFELFDSEGVPVGWTRSTLPSSRVTQSDQAYRGKSCIKLENRSEGNAPLWIQSSPITLPRTGRMAVELWIRRESGTPEPQVRLNLLGRRTDGTRFERSRWLGRNTGDATIPQRWESSPMVLLVSDLPTAGIDDLRVEIDLVGSGTIYIDEVKLFDIYLHPDERNLIRNQIFAASEPFRDPSLKINLDEIDRLWHGYWGEYLRRFVPLTSVTPDTDQANNRQLSDDPTTGNQPQAKPALGNQKSGEKISDTNPAASTPASPGILRRRLSNLRNQGSTVDR